MEGWQRPASVPHPKIYSEFEGKELSDGSKGTYWIQEISEEFVEEVVKIYLNGFLRDEPIAAAMGMADDPGCREELAQFWRNALKYKIGVICLTKDTSGNVKIAGFNTLIPKVKNQKDVVGKCPQVKIYLDMLKYLETRRDMFEEFGVESYLSAFGLYVLPEFRQQGLAEKLLLARYDVGRTYGFKLSMTWFSSPGAHKAAARSGYKEYVVYTHADLTRINSEWTFPGIDRDAKIGKFTYILC